MSRIAERTRNIPPFIVMDVLERAHELERQGRNIIHLQIGEPDFPTPECICEAAKEAIGKAREVNDQETLSEDESAENNEKLDEMEDSLTTDFEKLAQEIQDELDSETEEDGEISNESSMELVRKLIKLKSLATPHDREEVDRIENEIKIKIEGK